MCQDYFLYEEVYRAKRDAASGSAKVTYDFFRQDFRDWIDCIPGLTIRNTEDWFRYFLQRGFVETYGACLLEHKILEKAYKVFAGTAKNTGKTKYAFLKA